MNPGGKAGSTGSFLLLIARCFGCAGAVDEPSRLGRLDDFFRVHTPLVKLGLLLPLGEVPFRGRSGRSGDPRGESRL
jgi:hypothetical protein